MSGRLAHLRPAPGDWFRGRERWLAKLLGLLHLLYLPPLRFDL
jgi:hypothetical protein